MRNPRIERRRKLTHSEVGQRPRQTSQDPSGTGMALVISIPVTSPCRWRVPDRRDRTMGTTALLSWGQCPETKAALTHPVFGVPGGMSTTELEEKSSKAAQQSGHHHCWAHCISQRPNVIYPECSNLNICRVAEFNSHHEILLIFSLSGAMTWDSLGFGEVRSGRITLKYWEWAKKMCTNKLKLQVYTTNYVSSML